MCKAVAPYGVRLVARFAFAGLTAALLAGCADTSRFTGDPLGNPFRSASATDPAPTGSVDRAPGPYATNDMAPPPYQPRTAVVSRPLAAPSRVATYEAPVRSTPTYVAPRAERTASYGAPSGHGSWSASGGMAIVAANGETAAVLADRYNVPREALLHANGFSSSGDIRPGTRLIIPVYSANGARVAVAEPVAVRSHDHSGRERLARAIAERQAAKLDAERQAAADAASEREAAKHKTAKRESDGETMHWVRGAQPARKAELEDKRVQRKAEVEDKRALRKAEVVDDKAARKAAKVAKLEAREEKSTRMAKVETVREVPAPRQMEAAPPRKAQSDPTPTASLPPADEKVTTAATNGGPEFRWPAHGRIIQGFKTGGNDGINIAVPEGTSVKAAESGVVAYAGSEIKGFGNLVLIRHPNGFVSAYANNGDIAVHRGEQVKRGQTIAKSGQSGNVASPQLHFELRKGSTPVDPTRYLAGL